MREGVIRMKRTNKFATRAAAVLLGIAAMLVGLYASHDTRSVIQDYLKSVELKRQIKALDPQTEKEFWDDLWTATQLMWNATSVFSPQIDEVADMLVKRPDGSYKPWASSEFRSWAIMCVGSADQGMTYEQMSRPVDKEWLHAYDSWHSRRGILLTKATSCAALGGFLSVLGFLLPWILFPALLCGALIFGRGGSFLAHHETRDVVNISIYHGGDGAHSPDIHDVAVPGPQIGWLVVWVMLFVTVIRDRRWITRGIRTMSARAPPFRKESAMLRAIIVVIALLCVSGRSSADSVSLFFGEQLAGTGSAAELTLGSGSVVAAPWLALDGSKFEAMPMWQFGGTPDSLVIGPLLGMSYDKTGTTPYFGMEIRGKLKLGPGMFLFRLAERHTREKLLNRFANLGIEAGPRQFKARLSYQPLRRNNLTVQRLALKATVPYQGAKIGLEVRSSLDEHHRKGAMLDLVIPMK